MKKLISILTVLMLCTSIALTTTGCLFTLHISQNGGNESEEVYTFDETHHWILQSGGTKKDYAEHSNPESGKDVGMCKCGYYFPCHNLVYQKTEINGKAGYEVVDYNEDMSPNFYHVEIPTSYQGEEDSEPLPVISVADYALSNNKSSGKCGVALESIKFNEGLLSLGDGAVCYSNIKEITIPNSVVGNLHYTFRGCSALKKIVIGDGITSIGGYTFQNVANCHTIIFGNSVKEIRPRSIMGCSELRTVVLPASLISMPEGSHVDNALGCEPQTVIFPGDKINIYFQITRDVLENRTISLFPRDSNGNLLNPDGTIAHEVIYKNDNYYQQSYTIEGFNENWYGLNTVYCLGEWEYDENNLPKPSINE